MKLGFSLKHQVFLGEPHLATKNDLIAHCSSVDSLLDILQEEGISSIELRVLSPSADEGLYRNVIQSIWDRGMELTVHGQVTDINGESFTELYPSISFILNEYKKYQKELVITTHACSGHEGSEEEWREKTILMLQKWAKLLEHEPVKFALENNRKKSDVIDPGNDTLKVLEMVREIDRPKVGVCWDMGHFYSNLMVEKGMSTPPEQVMDDLPPSDFISRVYHTHIHGIGTNGRTHHPLVKSENLPLDRYVSALQDKEYKGVYNLELSMERFDSECTLSGYVVQSIRSLKKSVLERV